ncbi:MAG: RNA polymerase sigma factor [Deltaproteobacteria bacterium]|nr:RNA polymerase sigma factor [Deltaproteobacteria bacterium]
MARMVLHAVPTGTHTRGSDDDYPWSELVRASASGDERARRVLVERTLPMVHRMMSRLVGRRADHDDLVQTVYARCFRSLQTFRGDAKFTTWLGSICVNVASTYWQQRKNHASTDDVPELMLVDGKSPEAQIAARAGLRIVARLLSEMTPALRSAFVLHVLEGHDIDTVAAMSGTSVGATYKAVERARQQLEAQAAKHPDLARFLSEGSVRS